jgi:beta-lactamase regulating signal transducer with metallopeptidase domain
MKDLVSYLIELNIAITVFFLVYVLLFRKDSNFSSRRLFLLFAMGASFLIPLVNIPIPGQATAFNSPAISIEELIFYGSGGQNASSPITTFSLLIVAYVAVSIFFIIKLVFNIFRILKYALHSEKTVLNGRPVRISKELHGSSFFSYIFIDPTRAKNSGLKHILEHEACHVRLLHSVDRMITEIVLCFNWFNPVVWMLRKTIVVNHEYQADNKMIEQGSDQVNYQLTILNQYLGSASISNQFSSQIKKRIIMLNKTHKKGNTWKSIMLVPVSLLLLFFMSCNNEAGKDEPIFNEKEIDDVFYVVEEMPQWPGSDDMSLSVRKFIAENLIYPEEAKLNGIEGQVFVNFMVTKNGDVIVPDPSVLPPSRDKSGNIDEVVVVAYRPLDESQNLPDEKYIQLLKDESVRVVELMPDLIPGKQRGQEVNVVFTMPIYFKLQ